MEGVSDAFAAAADVIEARDGQGPENFDSIDDEELPERELNYSDDDTSSQSAGNGSEEELLDDDEFEVEGESPVETIVDWSKPDAIILKKPVKYDRRSKSQKALISVIQDNQQSVNHNAQQATFMYRTACRLAKLGGAQDKLLKREQAANVKNRKAVRDAEKQQQELKNVQQQLVNAKSNHKEKLSEIKEGRKKAQEDAKEYKEKFEKSKKELKSANAKLLANLLEINSLKNEKNLLQSKFDLARDAQKNAEEELKKYKNKEFGAISQQNKRVENEQYKANQQNQRNDQRTTQFNRAASAVGGFQSGSGMALPPLQVS